MLQLWLLWLLLGKVRLLQIWVDCIVGVAKDILVLHLTKMLEEDPGNADHEDDDE